MGISSLPMFAKDKTTVLQIAQGQPDGDATDLKAIAELMFAGDGKSGTVRTLQYFFGKRRH